MKQGNLVCWFEIPFSLACIVLSVAHRALKELVWKKKSKAFNIIEPFMFTSHLCCDPASRVLRLLR